MIDRSRYGQTTKPFQGSIDGKDEEIYMITMGFDLTLKAGTASNVAFTLSVPKELEKYFEFLSVRTIIA